MNATLVATVFSSNAFDHNKGSFVAEASTLGRGFLGKIWNDSADVGFAMRSIRTGDKVIFALEKEHRDDENEITHWVFKPTAFAIRNNPDLANVKATVFND